MNKALELQEAISASIKRVRDSIEGPSIDFLLCELHALKSLFGFAGLYDEESTVHNIEKSILASGSFPAPAVVSDFAAKVDALDLSAIDVQLGIKSQKVSKILMRLERPRLSLSEYDLCGHAVLQTSFIAIVIIDPDEAFVDSRLKLLIKRAEESLFVIKTWVNEIEDESIGKKRIVVRFLIKSSYGELKIRRALSMNGILAVSIYPFKPEVSDLTPEDAKGEFIHDDFLAQFARALSKRLEKEIHWTSVVDVHGLSSVFAESLNLVLIQAIRNSLRHGIESPQQRGEKGKDPSGKLTLLAYTNKDLVRVELLDDGVGYEARLIMDQLEKSEAEVDVHGGHGIGLSVIEREIVDVLGGQFGIEDAIGGGTRFWLEFPTDSEPCHLVFFEYRGTHFALPKEVCLGRKDLIFSQINVEGDNPRFEFAGKPLEILDPEYELNLSDQALASYWPSDELKLRIIGQEYLPSLAIPYTKELYEEFSFRRKNSNSVYSKRLNAYIPMYGIIWA